VRLRIIAGRGGGRGSETICWRSPGAGKNVGVTSVLSILSHTRFYQSFVAAADLSDASRLAFRVESASPSMKTWNSSM
jgi:hypothetical protein